MADAPSPTLHVIYAGRGDALVLEYTVEKNGQHKRKFVILDGGPSSASFQGGAAPYSKYFVSSVRAIWNRNDPLAPSAIINSHTDDDHYEGILKLIKTSLPSTYQDPHALPNPAPTMLFNGDLIMPRARKWKGNSYVLHKARNDLAMETFNAVLVPKKFKAELNIEENPVEGIQIGYPRPGDLWVCSRTPGARRVPPGDTRSDLDAAAEGTGATPRELVRGIPKMADVDDSTTNLSSLIMWTKPDDTQGCIVTTGDSVGYRIKAKCHMTNMQVFKIQHHGSVRNSQLIGKDGNGNLIGDVHNPGPADKDIAIECSIRELAEQTWGSQYDQWQDHVPSNRVPFFCPAASSPERAETLLAACWLLDKTLKQGLTDALKRSATDDDCCEWLASLRSRHVEFLLNVSWTGDASQKPALQVPGWYRNVSPVAIHDAMWQYTRNDAANIVNSRWSPYMRANPPQTTLGALYNLRPIDRFFSYDTKNITYVPSEYWSFWCWEGTNKATKYWLAYYTNADSVRRVMEFYNGFDSDTYVVSANGSHGHPSPSVIAGLALVVAEHQRRRCLFVTNGFAISPGPIVALMYWAYRAADKDHGQAMDLVTAAVGDNGFLAIRHLAQGVYMSINGSANFNGTAGDREYLQRTMPISLSAGVDGLESLYKTLETDKTVLPKRSSGSALYIIRCGTAPRNGWTLDLSDMTNHGPQLVPNQQPQLHDIKENWETANRRDFNRDLVPIHVSPVGHAGDPYTCWVAGKPSDGYSLSFERNGQEQLLCLYREPPGAGANFETVTKAQYEDLLKYPNCHIEPLLFSFEKHDPPATNAAGNLAQAGTGLYSLVLDLQLNAVLPVLQVESTTAALAAEPLTGSPSESTALIASVAPATSSGAITSTPHGPQTIPNDSLGQQKGPGPRTVSLQAFFKAASISYDTPAQPWTVLHTMTALIGSRNLSQLKISRPLEVALLNAKIRPEAVTVTVDETGYSPAVRSAHVAFTPQTTATVKIDGASMGVKEGALRVEWPQENGISVTTDLMLGGDGAISVGFKHTVLPADTSPQPCSLRTVLDAICRNHSPPITSPDWKTLALPKLLALLTNRTPQDMTAFLMDRLPEVLVRRRFLQQVVDVNRSTAFALPSPIGDFLVKEAELFPNSSILVDAVKEALNVADAPVNLDDVKVILKNGGTPRETIVLTGGITISNVLLTFEVDMTKAPSAESSLNAPAVAWKFTAQKTDEPLANISRLWKPDTKATKPGGGGDLDEFSQKKPLPFSSSPLSKLGHSGVGFVVSQQVPRIARYKLTSIFAATSLSDWQSLLPLPLGQLVRKAEGKTSFDATAYVEIRNPLESTLRAWAVALNFEIEFNTTPSGTEPGQRRRLAAALMAEPITGTGGYDYRVSISGSDNGVTVPDVAWAVGYGNELLTLAEALPALGGLEKLRLKHLFISLQQEQKATGGAGSFSLGEFALSVTAQDLQIYKKIRLVSAEVDLEYCAGTWDGRVRAVVGLDTKRLEADIVLPQLNIPGFIEITAPEGLKISDVLNSMDVQLPQLQQLPFPQLVNAVTAISLDRISIDLQRQDKSVEVSGSTLELSMQDLDIAGISLYDVQAKFKWETALDGKTKQPQRYVAVTVEAATKDRNFVASVTYDAHDKSLSATFHAVKPRTVSELIKFILPDLGSNQLLDMMGGLGVAEAAVHFSTNGFKPTSLSISLVNRESVDIDKATISELEVSYVAAGQATTANDNKVVSPTQNLLTVRGVTTGKGTSASVSFLAAWATRKPPTISVVITPPSQHPDGRLTLSGLVGLFKLPDKLPTPQLPPNAPNLSFLNLGILHASGKVAFLPKDASQKSSARVQIESLGIVIQSQEKYTLPDVPTVTLEGLSLKVDYDRTRTAEPFKGSIWAYLRLPKDLILGLRYTATQQGSATESSAWKHQYLGTLSMEGTNAPQDKLLTFDNMANQYLGPNQTTIPPGVELPSPLRMTLVSAEYVTGEKFEISGGNEDLNKVIASFGDLQIQLAGIGGRIVKHLGKTKSFEATIHGSLVLKSLASKNAGAVLHIASGSEMNALLTAELHKATPALPAPAPGQPKSPPRNEVSELVDGVGGQADVWKTLAPEITRQDMAFDPGNALLKLLVDFGRKNLFIAGRIENVGQALLWICQHPAQNDVKTGKTASKGTYSYLLCVELESVTALWPSLADDKEIGSTWLSFDKIGVSAQISSDDISAAQMQAQIELLNRVFPSAPGNKEPSPTAPLVGAKTTLQDSAANAAKGSPSQAPGSTPAPPSSNEAPLVLKGARVQARISLDDRTILSKMLALSSDPEAGKQPRVGFEAPIPPKGTPATYTVTVSDFRMFEGAFVLRYARGSYVGGKEHKIQLQGHLEFHFDEAHTYQFHVDYWTKEGETGFEFSTPAQPPASVTPAPTTSPLPQAPSGTSSTPSAPLPVVTPVGINPAIPTPTTVTIPAPIGTPSSNSTSTPSTAAISLPDLTPVGTSPLTFPTPTTVIISVPVITPSSTSTGPEKNVEPQSLAFPEMFGLSLKISKLRGTISVPKPGSSAKRAFSCVIRGSVDIFGLSVSGQVVFIGTSPRALVLDVVKEVHVTRIYSDVINEKKSSSSGVSWPTDFDDIQLRSARIYYLKSADGKDQTVVLDGASGKPEDAVSLTLRPGFNLDADIELFENPFVVNVGLSKSGVVISGSYNNEIDFGFCVFTKGPDYPGPRVQISSLSERTEGGKKIPAEKKFEIASGIKILGHDGFDLSLQHSNRAWTGKASYSKSIPVGDTEIKGPISLGVRYEKGRFSFDGLHLDKQLDVDIEEALRLASNKVDTQCEKLVGKLFDKIVKTKFSWDLSMGGVKNGALTVLIGGKFHLSILNSSELDVAFDMPANLEVELKPNLFSLDGLVDHICNFLKTNASLTRLGEQILTNKENAAKIFLVMTVKNLAKKVIAALLCRKIAPPNIWPAIDVKLPPDDKDPHGKPNPQDEPTSWWEKFKRVVEVVLVAAAIVAAVVVLGEAIAALAEFLAVAEETLVLLDRAIKFLRAIKAPTAADLAKLARFETLQSGYQAAIKNAPAQMARARTQIRQNLNLTKKPDAQFSAKDGKLRLNNLSIAKPAGFVAGAAASKIAWDIVVTPTNTPPSNNEAASPHPKQTSVADDKAEGKPLDLTRSDLAGAKEIYAWARISYTDSLGPKHPAPATFVSESWMPINVVVVDDETWKNQLKTDFTLTAGPSVSVADGATIQADWTSGLPDAAKAPSSSSKYQDIGTLQWEVVASLSDDPEERGAGLELSRELVPLATTKWAKKVDPNLLGTSLSGDIVVPRATVFVHVRVVLDVGLTGARLAGPWRSSRKMAPKNMLGPGEWLRTGDYLVAAGGKLRFVLQADGNFVLYQGTRPLWSTNTAGTESKNLRVVMLENGNLELQQMAPDGVAVSRVRWSSNTASKTSSAGASLVLQEDGSGVIRATDGKTILWTTGTRALWPPSQKDRLQVGEVLYADDRIVSPNGRYSLVFQGDGNFVVYDGTRPIWAINTLGSIKPRSVQLGDDDNLVVDRGYDTWQSGTRRRLRGGRGALIMRDDGAAVIVSDGTIIWSTKPGLVQPWEPVDLVQCKQGSDVLRPGEFLAKGQSLVSPNGTFSATLQADGNFVLYRNATSSTERMALWGTDTKSDSVTRLCFGLVPRQLNLYGAGAQVRWSPQRDREYGADHVLRVGNDGNLAILPESADPYDYSGKTNRAWSAGTMLPVAPGKTTNTLLAGQALVLGQSLASTNGKYNFTFNKAAEMCITTVGGSKPSINFAWNPKGDQATRTNAATLAFTTDGYLEMRDATGSPVWREGPGQGSQPGRPVGFCMRDDGLAVVQVMAPNNTTSSAPPGGEVLWTLPQPVGDRLATGQKLSINQRLRSANGAYEFTLQHDRNIVLYKFRRPDVTRPSDHQAIWASGTCDSWDRPDRPDRLVMQPDGNLVAYQRDSWGEEAFWSTRTEVRGGGPVKRVLVLQDDGDVVLMDEGSGKVVWNTGTKGK